MPDPVGGRVLELVGQSTQEGQGRQRVEYACVGWCREQGSACLRSASGSVLVGAPDCGRSTVRKAVRPTSSPNRSHRATSVTVISSARSTRPALLAASMAYTVTSSRVHPVSSAAMGTRSHRSSTSARCLASSAGATPRDASRAAALAYRMAGSGAFANDQWCASAARRAAPLHDAVVSSIALAQRRCHRTRFDRQQRLVDRLAQECVTEPQPVAVGGYLQNASGNNLSLRVAVESELFEMRRVQVPFAESGRLSESRASEDSAVRSAPRPTGAGIRGPPTTRPTTPRVPRHGTARHR